MLHQKTINNKNTAVEKIGFFLLCHTIRYLKISQICFLLYYRMRKLRLKPIQSMLRQQWKTTWLAPAKETARSILSAEQVIFLGEKGELRTPMDWNNPQKSKLWLYHLHYFDELNTIHAAQEVDLLDELIKKWIRENPPTQGNGWEPYPLSLRLVNLVKWFSSQTTPVSDLFLLSLGIQAQALEKQLEYHIRGNHLFANGKALTFAGTYLSHERALVWLKKGLQILDAEVEEQFLADGGHFELSPMYHANLLWDLCDLVNLANSSGHPELLKRKAKWINLIIKAYKWLNQMCHPDGDISFFNDAAFDMAPSLALVKKYLTQLDIHPILATKTEPCLHHLKESGYCVVHLGENSKAILDVAQIGADYQPGHAHADTLSFEFSLNNQRILVNSGTSQYGCDELRQHQRSTKVHNTVSINGENSSEVWAGFRVARRAYPRNLLIEESPEKIIIRCSHDGYLRLAGRNIHQRTWTFSLNQLTIKDEILGLYTTAEARFHLHPAIIVKQLKHDRIECLLNGGKSLLIQVENAHELVLEPTTWHPHFGSSCNNFCLVAKMKGNTLFTTMEW